MLKYAFLFFFGWMGLSPAMAQLDTYSHKQELQGISDTWHSIVLPNTIFDRMHPGMSDIRIYGTTENDTLEAPYTFRIAQGSLTKKEVAFNLLNTASNARGYYFTYEIPTTEAINEIQLAFENENFDWRIQLEGSENQREWFTLLDDYRILSIKNGQTDYEFTDLSLPESKYRYYRLLVKSEDRPKLQSASIRLDEHIEATYQTYPVTYMDIDQQGKRTIIDLDLNRRLPVSYLQFKVADNFDYYRSINIKYVYDSIVSEKGTRYSYRDLTYGTLTSVEDNSFKFPTTLARRFRAVIENYDNQPLQIQAAEAKGFEHRLIARFTRPATYYLAYGKAQAQKPKYDIAQAVTKIPDNPKALTLGDEQRIPKKSRAKVSPLFENKLWLWAVMGVIILVLGWFTLGMLKSK
ncbi:MAG: DUF3999 family protein [Pricia sp.]